MDLGQNMMLIRKKNKLSQAALGKMIGTSGDVVGRYERGDISPSIEVVAKIADALQVSVDYLIGKTKLQLDKPALQRLEDIAKLPEQDRIHVFKVLDALLRDFKTQQSYAS